MAPNRGGKPGFGVGSEGRKGTQGARPAFAPTGAWLEAFDAQAAPAMLSRVRRFASKLAEAVVHAGGVGGAYYAHELVQDALGDTLTGLLRWNPDAVSLEGHLCSRIRSRARHARQAAASGRFASLDHEPEGERGRAILADVETALSHRARGASTRSYAQRVMAHVRALAVADLDVLAILHAIESGAEDRVAILSATGLSAKAYRNARLRLCRLGRRVLESALDGHTSDDERNLQR
jgi:hypothetical protein